MNNRAEGASFVSFLYHLEVVFVLIGTRRGANFGRIFLILDRVLTWELYAFISLLSTKYSFFLPSVFYFQLLFISLQSQRVIIASVEVPFGSY